MCEDLHRGNNRILPEGQLSVQAFDLNSITKHGSGANICKIESLSLNSNWVAIHEIQVVEETQNLNPNHSKPPNTPQARSPEP